MAETVSKKPSPLDSTAPVFVPYASELFFDRPQFDAYLKSLRPLLTQGRADANANVDVAATPAPTAPSNAFMDALLNASPTKLAQPALPPNVVFTENGAVAHASTNSALLDLFAELEQLVASDRLVELLNAAWQESPLDTLKIIWNARSIHVGKGEKNSWYRSLGWLREHHPLTLIANLDWVVRPVIEKKLAKPEGSDVGGAAVVVEKVDNNMDLDDDDDEVARFDVKNGCSHGYYCDLINILMLAVHGTLAATQDPKATLNTPRRPHDSRQRRPNRDRQGRKEATQQQKEAAIKQTLEKGRQDKAAAKQRRHDAELAAHARFLARFRDDAFYRALHLRVARIFVHALQHDLQLLEKGTTAATNRISLAAKWAPSLEKMHDRATFVASTIAELLFPPEKLETPEINVAAVASEEYDEEVRTRYLRLARDHYRRAVSKLRAALDVVERKITAQRFSEIVYSRVPSIAMDLYKKKFAKHDLTRFAAFMADVAAGRASISGAVLAPSKLVKQALALHSRSQDRTFYTRTSTAATATATVEQEVARLETLVVDAQWATLLQRLRDSGTLDNAIAVCDVSGSMQSPTLSDGTVPLHTSLALSLLLAQLARPPWNGAFITFSTNPNIVHIDPTLPLSQVLVQMKSAYAGLSTDFNAVFERLLLPLAINHKLKQEDMVKRIFVFSDMQFNEAEDTYPKHKDKTWESNYGRIKRKYEEAGYELPELVFWNLAGRVSKPVTAQMEGTALVSGYSQAMLKLFLDNGGFDGDMEIDPESECEDMELDTESEGEDEDEDEGMVVIKKGKEGKEEEKRIDPLATVRKAIGHKSFSMLQVVD